MPQTFSDPVVVFACVACGAKFAVRPAVCGCGERFPRDCVGKLIAVTRRFDGQQIGFEAAVDVRELESDE